MGTSPITGSSLLDGLIRSGSEAARLMEGGSQRMGAGFLHTLREICQQPETWRDTSHRMAGKAEAIRGVLAGARSLTLTGSGSSEYAGECVRLALQHDLAIDCQTLSGGTILTHGATALPKGRPGVMVSLARSGDSPESVGALRLVRAAEPGVRHLVLTCNERGSLAREVDGAHVVTLDERTNDRSLVMTSSFTNLSLAARFLGFADTEEASARYTELCRQLAASAERLISTEFDSLARVARLPFRRAVFLGSGERHGAAREAALKMLEMTAGRIPAMAESFLGLRHGPMAYVQGDTLLVCFLSTGATMRRYERDLVAELNEKGIGVAKLLVGEEVPDELLGPQDHRIEMPGLSALGDANSAVLHVVVGQLLAFFRCLDEGLEPDSPSKDGVINRVVNSFKIHSLAAQ